MHEEGQFAAVCVDVVDLGMRVTSYPGKPQSLAHKCAIVFLTTTSGETKDVSIEATVSMGDRATLRKVLEDWRGRSYTPEQAAAGVPLDKLVGVSALLSVEHKKSLKGRAYANVKTVAPLPKEMTAPTANGYVRPGFWAERKKAYAAEAALFKQTVVAKSEDPVEPIEDDDSDLPF